MRTRDPALVSCTRVWTRFPKARHRHRASCERMRPVTRHRGAVTYDSPTRSVSKKGAKGLPSVSPHSTRRRSASSAVDTTIPLTVPTTARLTLAPEGSAASAPTAVAQGPRSPKSTRARPSYSARSRQGSTPTSGPRGRPGDSKRHAGSHTCAPAANNWLAERIAQHAAIDSPARLADVTGPLGRSGGAVGVPVSCGTLALGV